MMFSICRNLFFVFCGMAIADISLYNNTVQISKERIEFDIALILLSLVSMALLFRNK